MLASEEVSWGVCKCLENGYIPLGGLFDKSFKSLPFDLIAVLFGPKDPHPKDFM
jgi:hypothetical protein